MLDRDPPPLGTLVAVTLRVRDAERAARFFGALLGAQAEPMSAEADGAQRLRGRSPLVDHFLECVFTADPNAPEQRLLFQTPDPAAALERALALGASRSAGGLLRDDQGLSLDFAAAAPVASGENTAGALGVCILQVPDTARAMQFYAALFGHGFHRVGSGDFWWADAAPPVGVFPRDHDITNPMVPWPHAEAYVRPLFAVPSIDAAASRIAELGGQVHFRTTVGPYGVCSCTDDQLTPFGLWHDPMRAAPG